jgi:hypothetical protein
MSEALTVACVLVRGHVSYTREYVTRLYSMVKRNLQRDYIFICLTDQPKLFHSSRVTPVEIPPVIPGMYAWWSKLHLFNRQVKQLQQGRCLYLDLDSLVLRALDPVVDYAAAFALAPTPDYIKTAGKGARQIVKKFNSSVMVWNGGEQNALFDDFENRVSERLWGDQDWIGERSTTAVAMPEEWFPRVSQCLEGPTRQARVVLCKKPKNTIAAATIPWVREAWA